MRKEDFDEILKNEIDSQIKAPEKLKIRIRNEINKTEKKKSPWLKTMQGIAAVAVVAILSVTSYAAITGNLNLEKIGFLKASKNYDKIATEVNQTIENEYLKYTLDNIACDDAYLITEQTVELKDSAISKYGEVEYDENRKIYTIAVNGTQYINNQEIYCWGYDVQKITDNQYKILEVYNISNNEDKNINLVLNINGVIVNNIENFQDMIHINKQISMDIERKESSNKKFEEVSQTIGNQTFVVKEAANTNFETLIKASIITEESYDEYLKEDDSLSDNSFMATQGNGDDISFEVYKDENTYVITDDGSMFTTNDLETYLKNQQDKNETVTSTDEQTLFSKKDSDAININQIIEKYGKTEDLKKRIVKIQKNYTIKIGSNQEEQEVKNVKLLPVKKNYINDRTDEELQYYNEAKWYKLENKKYTATSELGGTLEISSIDITENEITFNYDTKGLIGEDALILMRQNNGEFNYFYPEKEEVKGISSNVNKMTFYRKNNNSASSIGYNIKTEDIPNLLDDISKDEFTMLFGKKNGTEFIGDGIGVNIPDKITDENTIKNLQVTDIQSDENYDDIVDNLKNENNTISDQTNNVTDDNSITEDINNQSKLSLEEYSKLLEKTKAKIQSINSKGEKMDKNTASLSGIKIGSTLEEVHNLLKEKPENSSFDDDGYGEEHYYSDDIIITYELKNNKYCVTYISSTGRLKTNTDIQVGDSVQKVIENNAKDSNILDINEDSTYHKGWVLYGGVNATYIEDVEGYVKNSDGGKKAYCLVNNYHDDYSRETYQDIEILYFDDEVCMSYLVINGVVNDIELSPRNDMENY